MLQLLLWKGLKTQMIIQLGMRETVEALLNILLFLKTGLFKKKKDWAWKVTSFLRDSFQTPRKSLATKVREHLTRNTLSYCWPVLEEENGLQHVSHVAAAHRK